MAPHFGVFGPKMGVFGPFLGFLALKTAEACLDIEERHDLKGFFEGFWSKPTTGARPGPRLATSLVQLRCNSLLNRRLLRGAAIVNLNRLLFLFRGLSLNMKRLAKPTVR